MKNREVIFPLSQKTIMTTIFYSQSIHIFRFNRQPPSSPCVFSFTKVNGLWAVLGAGFHIDNIFLDIIEIMYEMVSMH